MQAYYTVSQKHDTKLLPIILKIGQYLVKLWARVWCLVFLTHGVVPFCYYFFLRYFFRFWFSMVDEADYPTACKQTTNIPYRLLSYRIALL